MRFNRWRCQDGPRWWWANLLLAELLWCYWVLGQAQGWPWWLPLLLLPLYLLLAPNPVTDLRRCLWLAPLGYALDSLWQWLGLITFLPHGLLPPPWLAALWLVFALTLPHQLFFLRHSTVLVQAAVGLLVPLTYFGGAALGAATLPLGPLVAYPALAAGWLLLLPLALRWRI